MFIKNSTILLSLLLICIKFSVADQGLEGESCMIGQVEGVCSRYQNCKSQCTSKKKQNLLPCNPLSRGIVCCPKFRNVTSKSAKKCQEYKEFACNVRYVGNVHFGTLMETKISKCATITQFAIINGVEALQKEFPHMALVGFIKDEIPNFICGGSLISHYFVLTAGHCLRNKILGQVTHVRLGEHDTNIKNESKHIDLNVTEVILYPDYSEDSYYYDIGLLKLGEKVVFNAAIRPLCLPEYETTEAEVIATGWGYNGRDQRSNVLLKVTLDVFDHDKCSDNNLPQFRLLQGIHNETQFCAGSHTHNNNTCAGDSGGPVQVIHPHYYCTFTIVGVSSFGVDCVDSNSQSSGVYTRVLPFVEWIEKNVWTEELEP